jgi:hypothetical protein
MLTVFQYNFFNLFTLITPAVHGFMNLGYYYNKNLEYLFCTWYAAFTVLALFYFAWVAWSIKKLRAPALQVLAIGAFLAVNNFYTPELIEMCIRKESFDLGVDEGIVHFLALLIILGICYRFTKSADIFYHSVV